MNLTAKQKRFLRSRGQTLPAAFTVGKEGMTDAALRALSDLLGRQELLKVKMPAGSADDRQLMGDQLAQRTGAVCLGVVGRTALLYRPNPDLPPDKRLRLPE
jgi:RNA-binding protein